MIGVKSETIQRLLLSRSLIAPLRFRSPTDRFSVAAHVLAAHDAAELAIGAICTENSVPNISDIRAMGLPDYLGALKQHLHPEKDVRGKDYVSVLNRVRVNLKHHGILPDKEQWGGVAETAFEHIAAWCKTYLNIDYAELDATELIIAVRVREHLHLARNRLNLGQYRECLESLAEAMFESRELFPNGVRVGNADANEALALSGQGVDPGRYMSLQRFLPTVPLHVYFGFDFEVHWGTRQYGHKANWTRQNCEFAYEGTVDLLTRLQQAKLYPAPRHFSHVFKDVLVVKKDAPGVKVLRWLPDGWHLSDEQPAFEAGDRIECSAFGSALDASEILDPEQCADSPEDSLRVVATDVFLCAGKLEVHPVSQKTIAYAEGRMGPSIIFERDDVAITIEPIISDEMRAAEKRADEMTAAETTAPIDEK